LLLDLLVLAYQTDMTRVSTFCLAKELSGRAYPEIGVPDAHHPVSHHQDEPAKLERLHKINEYHMRQFAYLVDKLSKLPEGDGTMLDYTLFMYGTGISDSNTHFHDDLPIALIGGKAAGKTRDPTLAPRLRQRQRQLVGERLAAARRQIGQANAQRLGGYQLRLLVGQEVNTRHHRVGLDDEVTARVGRQEGVVAQETAGAGKALGQRREVAGYELEFADAATAHALSRELG
jgi:hypothetical protein